MLFVVHLLGKDVEDLHQNPRQMLVNIPQGFLRFLSLEIESTISQESNCFFFPKEIPLNPTISHHFVAKDRRDFCQRATRPRAEEWQEQPQPRCERNQRGAKRSGAITC